MKRAPLLLALSALLLAPPFAVPAANFSVMRHSHIACHAAAIAWMLGRKLRFDPVKEEFTGDEEANRMRSRAMREPWQV